MEGELAIMIPIAFFFFVYLIVKTVSDNRLKRIAVEQNADTSNLKHLFYRQPQSPLSSLKWGMLLVGIGAGLTIGKQYQGPDPEVVMISSMVLGAGIALVIFYILARMLQKDKPEEKEPAAQEKLERQL